MSSSLRVFAGAVLAALAGPALAALSVFATVPEWGALAQELGGDKVSVYVATNALQDPHHVEAKPSLIARARGANLVVATGAELEIGWLPLVTQQAGNPAIQPGKPGAVSWRRQLDDGVARLFRGRGVCGAAGETDAARSRGRRRASRRQSAHPDRSAQHRARRRTALRETG